MAAAGGASTSAPAAAADAAATAPRWQALDGLQLPSFVKIKSKEKVAPMSLAEAISRVQVWGGVLGGRAALAHAFDMRLFLWRGGGVWGGGV